MIPPLCVFIFFLSFPQVSLAFLQGRSFGPVYAKDASHAVLPRDTPVVDAIHTSFTPGFIPHNQHITGNFWLKVDLANEGKSEEESVLVFHFVNAGHIDLYNDVGEHIGQQGNLVPAEQRSIPARMSAFKIKMDPQVLKTFYFCIHKHKSTPFTFLIVPYNWFIHQALALDNFLNGVFYGLCIFAILCVFLMFIRFREILLLEYLLFLISSALAMLAIDGNLDLWFCLSSYVPIYRYTPLVPAVALIYICDFVGILAPWIRFLRRAVIVIVVLFICTSFITELQHYVPLQIARGVFCAICCILGILVSSYGVYRSATPKYFLLGSLAYCSMALIHIGTWGALPIIHSLTIAPFYNHAFQFGSAIEFFVFTLAMFQRAKIMERDRNRLILERAEDKRKGIANASIARQAQMIAHDLKKPLQVIKIYAKMLSTKTNGNQDLLSKVNAMIQYAEEIANDLLLSNPNQSLHLESLDLEQIIKNINDSATKVSIKVQIEHRAEVQVDLVKFTRVIRNLVDNAEDMISNKDRIWITSRDIREADEIEIIIGNSGTYIDKEFIEKIFDDFSTFGKKHGTGLGLAICKQIVESHGGRISCRSCRNVGTEFKINLPTKPGLGKATLPELRLAPQREQ